MAEFHRHPNKRCRGSCGDGTRVVTAMCCASGPTDREPPTKNMSLPLGARCNLKYVSYLNSHSPSSVTSSPSTTSIIISCMAGVTVCQSLNVAGSIHSARIPLLSAYKRSTVQRGSPSVTEVLQCRDCNTACTQYIRTWCWFLPAPSWWLPACVACLAPV